MNKRIRIDVTAEDIANGSLCNCKRCPHALAARRAMPLALDVEVFDGHVQWYVGSLHCKSKLPDAALAHVRAIDMGREVGPISYEIEANASGEEPGYER